MIGTGQIGASVIRNLSGFGCRILAYDIYEKEGLPCEYVALEEIYEKSDVITIHTPATPESYHMINIPHEKGRYPGELCPRKHD